MIKNYEITIKGYLPKSKIDDIVNKSYADLSGLTYGKIFFRGTEQEFDKFYDEHLLGDETYFKIIGINY